MESAVRGVQCTVAVDIVRHGHAAQRGNSSGIKLQAVAGIQRTARHLQHTAGLDSEVVLTNDTGILQLQFTVLFDVDIGRCRRGNSIRHRLVLRHQRAVNVQGMSPVCQRQLRALFQAHRLIPGYGNGSGTSVAARQRRTGQRGQRAVAHLTRHADIGICCRHSVHRYQQVCGITRELAADAVGLHTAESVATTRDGVRTVGHVDIRLEFAVVGIQGAVVVDV